MSSGRLGLGLVLSLFALAFNSSCVPPTTLITGVPSLGDSEYAAARDEVFEAALLVAQEKNLNVAVLEKQSGLMRFESATLSPAQLDQYCKYMFVKKGTTEPVQTYQKWSSFSTITGAGNVWGVVSISFLLTSETPTKTKGTLRANWTGRNAKESYALTSLGVLEGEFVAAVRQHLKLAVGTVVSPPDPLAIGSSLYTKEGAVFGRITDRESKHTFPDSTSGEGFRVARSTGGFSWLTRDQALGMVKR